MKALLIKRYLLGIIHSLRNASGGSDKIKCGKGTDTVIGFNPDEGDTAKNVRPS